MNIRIGAIGKALAPRHSWCSRCETPWKFVRGHSTTYASDGSGCFPLCERCWQELETPEKRLPYYRRLWHLWCSQPIRPDDPEEMLMLEHTWDQIRAAVEAEK